MHSNYSRVDTFSMMDGVRVNQEKTRDLYRQRREQDEKVSFTRIERQNISSRSAERKGLFTTCHVRCQTWLTLFPSAPFINSLNIHATFVNIFHWWDVRIFYLLKKKKLTRRSFLLREPFDRKADGLISGLKKNHHLLCPNYSSTLQNHVK